MSATARTIHLPGATALAAIAQRARAGLASWAAEWTIGGAAASPTIEAASLEHDVALDTPEFESVRTPAGTLWCRRNIADLANFGRAVVGSASMPRGKWADEAVADIIEHAWSARNRALAAALLNSAPDGMAARGALPANLFELGAGSVHFSCELSGLHLVADHSIWRSAPPSERARNARTRLTTLDDAVRRPTARIEVVLGAIELDLSSVLDLRSGDVLRLPQRLNEGLSVLCEGQPLARGALGERDGRVCVQLTSR
jgi:hypothetical protein